ncbi:hypothetical protein NE237_027776 [Protea cynaroides]|uniref:AtPDCT1/2 transmembrane domain-containing protein n=1 Tax=Protea cynaroides TaxID=273540 RepID=A0A9Q0JS92_9MAGN|nr:hypothetical protein NE237_027776 [Protea cynaroides]
MGNFMKKNPKRSKIFYKEISRLMNVVMYHPIPCALVLSLLFFMDVEYTLFMAPPSSPPFDLGFALTHSLHRYLVDRPSLNTFLAALNTVSNDGLISSDRFLVTPLIFFCYSDMYD